MRVAFFAFGGLRLKGLSSGFNTEEYGICGFKSVRNFNEVKELLYENMVQGIFIERPNRFIAYVSVNGERAVAHVKNTGRCKELLIPGARVILRAESKEGRKTPYSLICVYKGDMLINMDSQIPNYVVEEALGLNKIAGIEAERIKREQRYGDSRFDVCFRNKLSGKDAFMEVKGVTLEVGGIAKFPDAPTARGAKHINHLIKAAGEGYEAYIFFLVQIGGLKIFTPNKETDPVFAESLRAAYESGVKLLCYNSNIAEDSITINEPMEIIL